MRPEVHGRQSPRRGDDRAAAVLGLDARVRGDAAELGVDGSQGRCADDHRARRSLAVEDEDHGGGHGRRVQRLGALQADLLARS